MVYPFNTHTHTHTHTHTDKWEGEAASQQLKVSLERVDKGQQLRGGRWEWCTIFVLFPLGKRFKDGVRTSQAVSKGQVCARQDVGWSHRDASRSFLAVPEALHFLFHLRQLSPIFT